MKLSPRADAFDWSNLRIRVLSAAILIPLTLFALWAGGTVLLVLLSVGIGLLAVEWSVMSAPKVPARIAWSVGIPVIIALWCAWLAQYTIALLTLVAGLVFAVIVARQVAERPTDAALGVVYLSLPGLALLWLRGLPAGDLWTVLVFVTAWAADIGAFAFGNLFKGPKLWPRFSPKKTWTGLLGGLLAGGLAGLLADLGLKLALGYLAALAMGLTIGAATMIGDLWESRLKRGFGVKDAGQLIPGHGGLLDRVDGLMCAVTVVAALRYFEIWMSGH